MSRCRKKTMCEVRWWGRIILQLQLCNSEFRLQLVLEVGHSRNNCNNNYHAMARLGKVKR